ncbi:unnamed protein product [Medioppia subpectinata]|uniref:Bicarbonate transporter-like transmembrane domain-containing protein n=1 Tax=Medioppia subpectinata TaxID=1979941 RepID=A0A7R9KMX4_9ACAR|nr:unnamed protein product [Medioppia subpectinata]CAG2105510.1 unnamed protein product [Medioppia subpectinata]
MQYNSSVSVESYIYIQNNTSLFANTTNGTENATIFDDLTLTPELICRRESSLLFLLLMLGTVWLAVSLFNFNKTPYLQASKRELLADYALPCAVLLLSFIGSFVFRDIPVEHFRYSAHFEFSRARLEYLPWTAFIACMGLGFSLSLLFFMDQNISAAMVNNPCNKLKKGCAYHLDLFVVGILNGFLSMYGLPWMHGVLPHSPLHVRSLADVEERVDQGHAAYPPNHYIRRCPQRKIHMFTLCQMIQLGLMCFFGFSPWPYVKMVFPVIILLLLPFRHKIVPVVIDQKYLEALDGENQ